MKRVLYFQVRCTLDDEARSAPDISDIHAALEDVLTSPMSTTDYGVSDISVTQIPDPNKTEGGDE